MNTVNSNQEIRPFLKKFPFTPHELIIEIYVTGVNGQDLFDPSIRIATAESGKLTYKTFDKMNSYAFKTNIYEPYEDALRIVKAKN